jgi:hypothetical protein
MSKLILKETGKEVKMGDKLIQVATMFGLPVLVKEIIVSKKTIPDLIKRGVIVEEGADKGIDFDIPAAVVHLAERIGWNSSNLDKYLDNLYRISPAAVFSVLLKEVAIMLDEKYPDHINKSKEVWVISTLDGEIKQIKELHKIKNFRNFAAFRSLDDALTAKKIMTPALQDLYGRK